MKTFFEKILENISLEEAYNDCFLFPTKRASIVFRNEILKELKKRGIENPIFEPYCDSLVDFVHKTTKLERLDNINLTFQFFEVYHEFFPNEKFETFFSWSSIFLNDFSSIDLANAEPHKILANVSELQKVDVTVQSFGTENPSEFRERFFRFWENLLPIYQRFTEKLLEKKSTYYGLAAKQLLQNQVSLPYRNLYFCGFSDFHPVEIQWIKSLKDKAKFYFDTDTWYFEGNHEAGNSFRKYYREFEKEQILSSPNNSIDSKEKKIYIIPTAGEIEQTKSVNVILNQFQHNPEATEKIAIILNNNKLITALLHAIPDRVSKVNITIGYPLAASTFSELVKKLLEIKMKSLSYYVEKEELILLFQNPLVRALHKGYDEKLSRRKGVEKHQKIFQITVNQWIDSMELKGQLFDQFWKNSETINGFLNGVRLWLLELKKYFDSKEEIILLEELYHFYLFINKLQFQLDKLSFSMDWKTFQILLIQLLEKEFVPFSGEPIEGLQVMGLIESQCLDFEQVFVLSCNEGTLPPAPNYSSFIPMELKNQYQLRTPREADSATASHFFRLFHHAKKIFLFYNANDKDNEQSRFLKQISGLMNHVQLETRSFEFFQHSITPLSISVNKTAEIQEKIQEILKNGVAPTTLITYLACPLKFYFSKIEKFEEEESFEEDMQANEFGSVAHEAIENLINSFRFTEITEKNNAPAFELKVSRISTLSEDDIQNEVRKVFEEKFGTEPKGRNFLYLTIITRIIKEIFELDGERLAGYDAVMIVGMEKKLTFQETENLVWKGTLDRVESLGNRVQIIDYKSGKVGKLQKIDLNSFSEENIYANKEAFQMLFYSWLYSKVNQSNVENIEAGVISFRNLDAGVQNVETVEDFKFSEFETFLHDKIKEIQNPEIPFAQTKIEKNCKFCSYASICGKFD